MSFQLAATSFAVSAAISILSSATMLTLSSLHDHVSTDSPEEGIPRKIHHRPTPRIGGLAVFLGIIAATFTAQSVLALEVTGVALICLGAGLAEDLTRRVSPTTRYVAALLAGLLAYLFLDARIVRLDVAWLDRNLLFWPLSCALTVFAIASFAHAANLTDGTHGLASGLSIISLSATGFVAKAVGDPELAVVCWLSVGALSGFFVFNFPWGRIFLGDGGAYFSGTIQAVLTILLIQRNSSVSPWFALMILAHPVVETLFTVIRRTAVHQLPIGQPDHFHLHTLLYRHLLQDKLVKPRNCNAATGALLLTINAAMAVITVLHCEQTMLLIAQFLFYAAFFVLTWRWLMLRQKNEHHGMTS